MRCAAARNSGQSPDPRPRTGARHKSPGLAQEPGARHRSPAARPRTGAGHRSPGAGTGARGWHKSPGWHRSAGVAQEPAGRTQEPGGSHKNRGAGTRTRGLAQAISCSRAREGVPAYGPKVFPGPVVGNDGARARRVVRSCVWRESGAQPEQSLGPETGTGGRRPGISGLSPPEEGSTHGSLPTSCSSITAYRTHPRGCQVRWRAMSPMTCLNRSTSKQPASDVAAAAAAAGWRRPSYWSQSMETLSKLVVV
jgi:hypothetical protein